MNAARYSTNQKIKTQSRTKSRFQNIREAISLQERLAARTHADKLKQKEKEENPLESSDSEPSLLSQESYQRRKLLSQEKKQKNY